MPSRLSRGSACYFESTRAFSSSTRHGGMTCLSYWCWWVPARSPPSPSPVSLLTVAPCVPSDLSQLSGTMGCICESLGEKRSPLPSSGQPELIGVQGQGMAWANTSSFWTPTTGASISRYACPHTRNSVACRPAGPGDASRLTLFLSTSTSPTGHTACQRPW